MKPVFNWKVNGISIFSSDTPGVPTLPITASSGTVLDPLSLITTLPSRTVTAKVAAGGNVLILESQFGEPPGDFEIVCGVEEHHLPSGYHTARQYARAVTIAGSGRVMDSRFQTDLANCLHLKSVLARELMEVVVIPHIDLGDPPPPWVGIILSEIGSQIDREAHQARFLAHVVEAADPDLAAILRNLAGAAITHAHATNFVSFTDAEQVT